MTRGKWCGNAALLCHFRSPTPPAVFGLGLAWRGVSTAQRCPERLFVLSQLANSHQFRGESLGMLAHSVDTPAPWAWAESTS